MTALRVYDRFYGEMLKVGCPTGSGREMTLNEVAMEIGGRVMGLFLPDEQGRRACLGSQRDGLAEHVLFHEYFHGETGAGLGASHHCGGGRGWWRRWWSRW
jgi:hypothetical protein